MSLRLGLAGVLASALLPACNPYQNRDGEYLAGAVDPGGFPEAYLGAGGDPKRGGGKFRPAIAFVHGEKIGYFAFPFTDAQNGASDPLSLDNITPVANVYVFDPGGPAKCVAPKNYLYDQRRDMVRFDEQGAVFTRLPDADGYAPIVAEVPVMSAGEHCQDIKSEETLLQRADVDVPKEGGSTANEVINGIPDGKYLAWALIDPRADVLPHGPNGLGPEGWGWYNHYLTAYIDGGYIPTTVVPQSGTVEAHDEIVDSQTLYYPAQHKKTNDQSNNVIVSGKPGDGYDLVDHKRGQDGYSPICHVFSYTPTDPMNPPQSIDAFDDAEAASAAAPDADHGYIYCLQVAQ
jgi:hypothetical protein